MQDLQDDSTILFTENKRWFRKGLYDGIPIAAAYFAVAIAIGITARLIGLDAWQAGITSFLCHASSGQYAGFAVIAGNSGYISMVVITAIVSSRYLLMAISLSQKISEKTSLLHRLLIGFWITDEFYATAITLPGKLNPYYMYGLAAIAGTSWTLGTCLGVVAGNVLPDNLVRALGVSLYGMFLGIIMPEASRNRIVGSLIFLSMMLSFVCSKLPVISDISEGTRIILLTVLIAGAAAVFFPINTMATESTSEEKSSRTADGDVRRGGEA